MRSTSYRSATRYQYPDRTPEEGDLILVADGACVPNPGKMAWGAALYRLGPEDAPLELVGSTSGRFDKQGTNNVAEIRAVGEALAWVKTLQVEGTLSAVYSDSQLGVNILTGKWGCHAGHLRPIVGEVSAALQEAIVAIGWIPRSQVGLAHELAQCELRPMRGTVVEIAPPRALFGGGHRGR